jgi:hypothetical protein
MASEYEVARPSSSRERRLFSLLLTLAVDRSFSAFPAATRFLLQQDDIKTACLRCLAGASTPLPLTRMPLARKHLWQASAALLVGLAGASVVKPKNPMNLTVYVLSCRGNMLVWTSVGDKWSWWRELRANDNVAIAGWAVRFGGPSRPGPAYRQHSATRLLGCCRYHINPLSATFNKGSPVNMDTADVNGELFFLLIEEYIYPLTCPYGPSSGGTGCDNHEVAAPDLVITKLELVVDKQQLSANYLHCNLCVNGTSSGGDICERRQCVVLSSLLCVCVSECVVCVCVCVVCACVCVHLCVRVCVC